MALLASQSTDAERIAVGNLVARLRHPTRILVKPSAILESQSLFGNV